MEFIDVMRYHGNMQYPDETVITYRHIWYGARVVRSHYLVLKPLPTFSTNCVSKYFPLNSSGYWQRALLADALE